MKLRDADSAVFNAWCGGLFITLWSLIRAVLAAFAANEETLWLAILLFAEVIIYAALTYGIHHKSRFCAAGLFISFLVFQLLRLPYSINLWGILITGILGVTFFRGMIGTIHYQRIKQPQYNEQR